MSRRLLVAFATVSMLLAGCLIPERFNAKAEFQPDGSYSFTYAGTAVHAMAAMQLAKTGKLTAKDDESLEREVAALKRNPDVRATRVAVAMSSPWRANVRAGRPSTF
jgi:hypothetical protein